MVGIDAAGPAGVGGEPSTQGRRDRGDPVLRGLAVQAVVVSEKVSMAGQPTLPPTDGGVVG